MKPASELSGSTPPRLAVVALLLTLSACGTVPRGGGGYYEDDGPGGDAPDLRHVADAVPKSEPRAASGNRPYSVNGRSYQPLADAAGYRERGVASWYGRKFHGRRTSSGETYDMYAMTAAHKTLPLPTYVRVRNLENGRSTIVRVNDRGPFLHNRLIDLSYAAAARLGIVGTGTGVVEVETVTAADEAPVQVAREPRAIEIIPKAEAASAPAPGAAAPGAPPRLFVQVGAFREWDNAIALRNRLERAAFRPIAVQSVLLGAERLYRVRIGPVANVEEGDRLTESLARHGVPEALILVE